MCPFIEFEEKCEYTEETQFPPEGYEEETQFPPEGYEEEWTSIWGKGAGEVKVEKEQDRSVFIAKFAAVRADTIERPKWDIDPSPPPADWALLGPLPADIPWNA